MNWSQALITILLGNTIVLIPILLNSHPGTKCGIPFPVFARRLRHSWIERAGADARPGRLRMVRHPGDEIGGEALNVFFKTVVPGWPQLLGAGFAGHSTTEWVSFLLFWGLNVFIIYRGMDLVRDVENWAAP
jgi:NCS1 family nucleobase:cation symporter-1